jgi:photosystem II stability/assembly factor-like uncharacterized protein
MSRPGSRRFAAAAAVLLLALGSLPSCGARRGRDHWEAVTIPTDAEFRGMWFTDSLNGWITGGGYLIDGGIVGRTRDGGRSWSFRSGVLPGGGASFALNRVQFLDTLRGCVTGRGGRVLVTDDGGETWRPARPGRSAGTFLFDVQFLDASNGWAVGSSSLVRTYDGGETWAPLVFGTSENGYFSGNAIHFVDLDHGWLVSRDATLMRSDDGGATWARVELPVERKGNFERPALWDVTFSGRGNGWTVGDQGLVLHTSDGGATWSRQVAGIPIVRVIPRGEPPRPREVLPELETPPDRLSLTAVAFADTARGWAVGYYSDVAESVVLRTDDGGASWRVERVVPGEELRTLFVLDANHAWAAGHRARTAPQVVLRFTASGR